MTKQNKGRKLFAVSATAALVASAIVPVASAAFNDQDKIASWAKDAVDYVVEQGYMQGLPNGNFDPQGAVTRAQAATVIAAAFELAAEGTSEFSDVKAGAWYHDAIVAATEAGILSGVGNGEFAPNANLTRAQAAVILVKAFGLEGTEGADLSTFADASKVPAWAEEALSIAVKHGIIQGSNGKLNPSNNITRQEFAAVFKRTVEAVEAVEETTVTAVKATNATTLTVTGTALTELKAEDVTVEGTTVKSVTVAEDGKSATVVLDAPLVIDTETKVTVLGGEFKVTYAINATGVAVVADQVFDNDTEDQFVKISVDGKEVTAQELITAGYTVDFEAFNKRTASAGDEAKIFASSSAESTTGELGTDILRENESSSDYYVKVTITKGSDVMVSSITKITVKNLDAVADSISEATLEVNGEFDLVSSTLVAEDTAEFTELVATVGGDKEYINLEGSAETYTVKSSDESVISVNKSTNLLTAEGPGTATITVTYGGATYTKSLTVKSEQRKLTTAKVDKTSVYVGYASNDTATTTFKVQAIDQYGDPYDAGENGLAFENLGSTTPFAIYSSDNTTAKVIAVEGPDNENGKLEYKVTVKGVDKGTADLTLRKAGTRVGSAVRVNVIENTTVSKYTLTVDNSISDSDLSKITGANSKNEVSTDSTIDTGDDKYVKINVKALNSAGQELPKAALNFTVTGINASDTSVLADGTGGTTEFGTDGVNVVEGEFLIVKAGSNDGTVTITITDDTNTNVKQSIKLTVTDKGVTISNVTFKNISTVTYATELNYKDFLSYVNSTEDTDPKITGLTLTKSASQAVRLDTITDPDSNGLQALYVDATPDSKYNANSNDYIIGYVSMAETGDVLVTGGTDAEVKVDAETGYNVVTGSDGTVIFRVYNDKKEIVASKAVKVDF